MRLYCRVFGHDWILGLKWWRCAHCGAEWKIPSHPPGETPPRRDTRDDHTPDQFL